MKSLAIAFTLLFILLVGLSSAVFSQTSPTRIPFVGCKSDGQIGPVEAPEGESRVVAINTEAANRLAYYKSAQTLGVLAPRGWYCFGIYGSSGSALYVSPEPINSADLFSANWKGFSGAAIQVTYQNGGTSGRFAVAKTIARVFPAHMAFVTRVIREGIEPASSFPIGPYPNERLTYKNNETVEYVTPARTKGLGTQSRLQQNANPITGVAILVGEMPDLLLLSARLPSGQTGLTTAIIRQVEHDAAH